MPGTPHEVLLMALHDQPSLLEELVRHAAGVPLQGPLTPLDATVRFAKSIELHPDLVFRGPRQPWIMFELQNAIDEEKRQSWLLAASVLCIREKAMGDVVILTASRSVATWAKRIGHQRGELGTRLELTPLVILLDHQRVEALLDPEHPELALFAAWAMQKRRGKQARQVVERAIDLSGRLPPALQDPQAYAILAVIGEHMYAQLETMAMNLDKFPESPGLKRLRLLLEKQGRIRGQAEGRAEGKAEGKAEGEAEGLAKGKQESLLAFLEGCGLAVTVRQRARILACRDLEVLGGWITKAASAASTRELLGEEETSGARRTGARAPPKRATKRRASAEKK